MEDEECVPENGPLKLYLESIGFSDLHVKKNVNCAPTSIKFDVSKSKPRWLSVESIDKDVIEQIRILISTQMLFEEDVSNIEKLLSNFKVVRNGMLKSMFQGMFGVFVIFLGLCLYWIIGGYAFFIVSSFYAYNAADYLSRKHFSQVLLKRLATVLQSNFMLLKKTMKFIEKNNKFVHLNNTDVKVVTDDFKEGFDLYNNFKSDFLVSVHEMISILANSTQKLIKKFPLYDYIENSQCYLCINENKNFESDVFRVYQIYLLVQSEFLLRLTLSLIPNIKLSSKDNVKELNKVVRETCINLLKMKNKLNKKFKYFFLNGVHCPKSKMKFRLPAKNKVADGKYVSEFVSNINDTSYTFQNLLIKTRILEDNIKCDKIPENVENELINMQNDLSTCQRNIEESFILLKKANSVTEKEYLEKLKEEELEKSDEVSEKVMVGYTDLDPKIEDEIFEAYFTGEGSHSDCFTIDEYDFEERLKKKLEKEYSKSVMKELKLKLIDKAKAWEKKENDLLKRKKLGNEATGVEVNCEKSSVSDIIKQDNIETISESITTKKDVLNEKQESQLKVKSDREPIHKYCNFQDNNSDDTHPLVMGTISSGSDFENLLPGDLHENGNICVEESLQTSIGIMNKQFLSDLSQARQKILKVEDIIEENYYCDSDED